MGLVDYSDSEDDITQKPLKRKRELKDDISAELPPLPASFLDLYSTATRVSTNDDPTLHGGRKRAIPHVEGNWATHLYLEWHPTETESSILTNLIKAVQMFQSESVKIKDTIERGQIHSLLQNDLGIQTPLHISLSVPLVLQTHQKDNFLSSITSALKQSSVRPFEIQFTKFKWVSNFDRTRWFLVLGVQKPANDELNRLLKACNKVARSFNQPELYNSASPETMLVGRKSKKSRAKEEQRPLTTEDDLDRTEAFHVSLAWSLHGDRLTQIQLDDILAKMESAPEDINVRFRAVKVKIGNAISNVEL
ncbi:hypothetical protein M501DRAFT_914359, partial [Patellaria atrata CBS 101060]